MKTLNILKFIILLFFINLKSETDLIKLGKLKLKVKWTQDRDKTDPFLTYGIIDLNINISKIGYIAYRKNLIENSCYISHFKIVPNWRSNKIGSTFLKHVCKKLIEQKITKIDLIAVPLDKESTKYKHIDRDEMSRLLILFYKSCGFKSEPGKPEHYMTYDFNNETIKAKL